MSKFFRSGSRSGSSNDSIESEHHNPPQFNYSNASIAVSSVNTEPLHSRDSSPSSLHSSVISLKSLSRKFSKSSLKITGPSQLKRNISTFLKNPLKRRQDATPSDNPDWGSRLECTPIPVGDLNTEFTGFEATNALEGCHLPLQCEAPEAHRAFRTITTLLSKLQDVEKFEHSGPGDLEPPVKQQLRILNALATVLVREHEVVAAVVPNSNIEHLQVIVCVHSVYLDADEQQGATDTSKSDHASSWNVLITRNYRRNDKVSVREDRNKSQVSFSEIDPRSDRKSEDMLRNAPDQPFEDHLKTIANFCTSMMQQPDEQLSLYPHFRKYVVAASAQKMYNRMRHALSKPFYDSLLSISAEDVSNCQLTGIDEPDRESDNSYFYMYMKDVTKKFGIPFPNLLRRVEQILKREQDQHPALYDSETGVEFHTLLCLVIERFRTKLQIFTSGRLTSNYIKELERVAYLGGFLDALCRSSAITPHLIRIAPLLAIPREDLITEDASVDAKNSQEGIEIAEEPDDDLRSLHSMHSTHSTPLWSLYRDWIQLMVAHFDAISLLTNHILSKSFPYKKLSFKLISLPQIDTSLFSWRALLKSAHIKDEDGTADDSQKTKRLSNRDIIQFLDRYSAAIVHLIRGSGAPTLKEAAQEIKRIFIDPARRSDANQVKLASHRAETLGELKEPLLLDWNSLVDDLISQIQKDPKDIQNVCKVLDAMIREGYLLDTLKELDSKKIPGSVFSGTVHCEAIIAALVVLAFMSGKEFTNYPFADVLDDFRQADPRVVIGLSKRCCPVCHELLRRLPGAVTSFRFEFIVRGSHNTISSCTLPPWLPKNAVEEMVEEFGHQLRRQLVVMVANTGKRRHRANSTGSYRLSGESVREESKPEIRLLDKSHADVTFTDSDSESELA